MSILIDTIAAVATPPGRGGIAVIRVSGPLVRKIMQAMFAADIPPRLASRQVFKDADDHIIDEGLALFFPNPHSFTGEDVLELQGHGGPVVVDMLLQRVLALGARLARPGEFSERAFHNNKIDLAQAEAIADLIGASSQQAAKLAMRSLQGAFSQDVHALTEKVIHLRMYIEAAIDFSTEEIDFLADEKILQQTADIIAHITRIQQQAKQGSFLREGVTAVIAGEPNVGKSSLLNCLSGKEIAIVTDIAGTTRDVLRDYILIDGIPIHIIDTAGLRESIDIVEQEGIKRAYQEIEKADLILYLLDATREEAIDLPPAFSGRKIIFIRNKIDLLNEAPSLKCDGNNTVINLSVKKRLGIDLLTQHIKQAIGFMDEEGIYLARRRHLDALKRANEHFNICHDHLKGNAAGELAAEELRLAQNALSEITGQFSTDDLLGRIFSSFCVGK